MISARAVAPCLKQTLLEEWMEGVEDLLRVDLVVAGVEWAACVPHQHIEHVL